MVTKYNTSDLPDLGVLNAAISYERGHTFQSTQGMVQVHTYAHTDVADHLKKVALIASAPALLHALIAFVEEREETNEEFNELNKRIGQPTTEDDRILINAKIAIRSALGLKQTDATVI